MTPHWTARNPWPRLVRTEKSADDVVIVNPAIAAWKAKRAAA